MTYKCISLHSIKLSIICILNVTILLLEKDLSYLPAGSVGNMRTFHPDSNPSYNMDVVFALYKNLIMSGLCENVLCCPVSDFT